MTAANGANGAAGSKPTKAVRREKRPANASGLATSDPAQWVQDQGIRTTADVPLPERLIDEVIGQDEAVAVAQKAARQGRNLLLLGDPGTGKSMIAKAMAQILPERRLDDILITPNPKDANVPDVELLPGGEGTAKLREAAKLAGRRGRIGAIFEWAMAGLLVAVGLWSVFALGSYNGLLILLFCLLIAIFFLFVARQQRGKSSLQVPNLIVERGGKVQPAPYVDATGSHAGALLGDIRHDPFQSGGLQTPTHERVEPGAIHRAHGGLLFIDEINVLRLDSQQALLTAMQDKQYSIVGQSERSSGAMARTAPVPCDFILVAAGNLDVIAPTDDRFTGLHPALRSRIRGYGYEVYVRSMMPDTHENRDKLVRFVAQEVRRDGKIPHFDALAVAEVIREAQRRSGHTGKLTLRLRELGGLVRTAGDLALDEKRNVVTVDDVLRAKRMSLSLEHQVTLRGIEVTTALEAMQNSGEAIGIARGCAFMGTGETGEPAGIVVPVEADATAASDRHRGALYVGGGLEKDGTIRDNVYALLKRVRGSDMADIDLHAQALLQNVGADASPLAAATAVACLSALENMPVRQDTVVLGALSVSGRLRAVDGVTQMVEAAADLGYTRAVVPAANRHDLLLEHGYSDKIDVLLADDLGAAVEHALGGGRGKVKKLAGALRTKASLAS
ncbi:MAG: ATP-dependent protease LonB [Thermoplasmatota archaeon]